MDVADQKWLELSDNLPLLLLDSVWASLLLAHQRPDAALSAPAAQATAAARLERAKGLLHRLHGMQMERLAGRADAGQQRAVYVRLRLLQGALSFHPNHNPNPNPTPTPNPNPNPNQAHSASTGASCTTPRACCAAPRACGPS